MSGKNGNKATAIADSSVDFTSEKARETRFDPERPYSVDVEIEGVAALLMHRYDTAEVETKSAAGKGTTTKKTDNLESYTYRDPDTGKCGIDRKSVV